MGIPVIEGMRIGAYIVKQHLLGRKRYPLVLMLEPLFRCNLACAGCGKIDYPDKILNQRLPYEDCMEAIDECGAPVVVVAGGEPLLHKDIGKIVRGALDRGKFVTLCTNALLLEKKMGEFTPSSSFNFSVHLDGDRDMHDKSVCQEGVYDRAVAAIKAARAKGFRVTINCTLFNDADPERVAGFLDTLKDMGVDSATVSPGYAYERAPDQAHFLNRTKTKELFRAIFRRGDKGRKWDFFQSSLFLDFLAGNQSFKCTPWGNPAAHGVRLATALLSAQRRLCGDVQGIDGDHGLGLLWRRQLREMRRLHGPLRLRAERRDACRQASSRRAEGGAVWRRNRKADGSRHFAR